VNLPVIFSSVLVRSHLSNIEQGAKEKMQGAAPIESLFLLAFSLFKIPFVERSRSRFQRIIFENSDLCSNLTFLKILFFD